MKLPDITADEFIARRKQEVRTVAQKKEKSKQTESDLEAWLDKLKSSGEYDVADSGGGGEIAGFVLPVEGEALHAVFQRTVTTTKGATFHVMKLRRPCTLVNHGEEKEGAVDDVVGLGELAAIRDAMKEFGAGSELVVLWGPEVPLKGGRRMRTAKKVLVRKIPF